MLTDSIKKRREESRKFRAVGDQREAEEGRAAGEELQKKAHQQQQEQEQIITKMNVCSKRALRTSFDLFLYATGKSHQHSNFISTHVSAIMDW